MPNHVTSRTKHAREILENTSNDWGGSEPLASLIEHRWAVVIEREGDSWVLGADTVEDIARHALNCYTGTEGYDEWIEGVYSLNTGESVTYTESATVTITVDGESATASTAHPTGL